MTIAAEIILAIVLTIVILGMAGGSMLLAFVIMPWAQRRGLKRQYPLTTKQGLMVSKIPVPGITLPDIERAVDMFLDKAEAKGYDRKKMLKEFGSSQLLIIRAVNEDGKRYIVDEYGRKIAGDNNMQRIRLVVIDSDTWAPTAGFHEFGHLGHETKGTVDYEHKDDVMWNEIVMECKREFIKS
jgi:hypothetical protein